MNERKELADKLMRELDDEAEGVIKTLAEVRRTHTQIRLALEMLKKKRPASLLIGLMEVDENLNVSRSEKYQERYAAELARAKGNLLEHSYLRADKAYLHEVIRGIAGLEVPRTR